MNVYMEDQFANRLVGLNTFQLRRMPGINTGDVSDSTWHEWVRRPRITYADAAYVRAGSRLRCCSRGSAPSALVLSRSGKQAKDIDVMAPTRAGSGSRTGASPPAAPSRPRKCGPAPPWWCSAT
jgi:hypothetical protein